MLIGYAIYDQIWKTPLNFVVKGLEGDKPTPVLHVKHVVLAYPDGKTDVFHLLDPHTVTGTDLPLECAATRSESAGGLEDWQALAGRSFAPLTKNGGTLINPSPDSPCAFMQSQSGVARLEVDEPDFMQLELCSMALYQSCAFVREESGGWVYKAVWSAAYVNRLPDSAFLMISSGGHKDGDGKTTPRSLRHLPVRDANGKLDAAHIRNALARIAQMDIPAAKKTQLMTQARRLLFQTMRKEDDGTITVSVPAVETPVVTCKGDVDRAFPVRLFKLGMPHSDMAEPPVEERFVLGVVLEPEVADAQGDIYDEDEIRKTAHMFMERYGGQLGEMHSRKLGGHEATILETYIAPVDFLYGDQVVKKGSWILGTRVNSDTIWEKVKTGEYNAWSIGGSAVRNPI